MQQSRTYAEIIVEKIDEEVRERERSSNVAGCSDLLGHVLHDLALLRRAPFEVQNVLAHPRQLVVVQTEELWRQKSVARCL